MKKIIILLLTMFLNVKQALAVNITNPGPGFFISYPDNSFAGLLYKLINFLLAVVGLITILFVIYGGFLYITSRGEEEQATAGKKTLTNAIIGLVIVILSYTVIAVIYNTLS